MFGNEGAGEHLDPAEHIRSIHAWPLISTMPMSIDIQRLGSADARLLDDLDPDVFDDPLDPAATAVFLADPRHHLVVALDGGRVVGFVSAVHYVHPDKPGPELWINEVGVASSHHGRGIGKALLGAMLDVGREVGCGVAWVLTDRSNVAAMRLYASAGGVEASGEAVMFEFGLGGGGRGDALTAEADASTAEADASTAEADALIAEAQGFPSQASVGEDQQPAFMRLWDFRDPAATEGRFRESLARLGRDGDVSLRVQVLSQIARTLGLRRDFAAARRVLDEADALLDGHDLPVARLRCLLERGRAFDSPVHRPEEKDPDAARRCFGAVFEEGRRRGVHGLAMDAAHMLGIVEAPDVALEWNLRAIGLAEGSGDPLARGWLGALYNNTGWVYHGRGEFAAALEMFEKARDWRAGRGAAGPLMIARWCVGRCLRSLGRVEEALAIQRGLVEAYAAGGEEDVGYVAEEMGECLLALGRVEEARPWFGRAFEGLAANEGWLLEAEPERMGRLKALGGDGGNGGDGGDGGIGSEWG